MSEDIKKPTEEVEQKNNVALPEEDLDRIAGGTKLIDKGSPKLYVAVEVGRHLAEPQIDPK